MFDSSMITVPTPTLEQIAEAITSPINDGPPDVIPGFLPRNGALVLAGETDIGKSLIALEICSSLITGNPLWGELVPTNMAEKILYVLGEHHNNTIKRLWQKTQLPMTDQVFLLGPQELGGDRCLVGQGRQNPLAVNKLKRWAEGCDLVVFDPFASFVSGVDVENDNITMRLVLDSMSDVAASVGAACVILAHQGKPMIDKFGQESARKSYAIRGASAIEDAATNIFYMGLARDGASEAAKKVGDSKILSLTRRKYKGEAPEEYRLLRDNFTLTHRLLGNRPFIEVVKMDRAAKVAKLQAKFPSMPFNDVIRAIAAVQGCSEATIKHDLGVRD